MLARSKFNDFFEKIGHGATSQGPSNSGGEVLDSPVPVAFSAGSSGEYIIEQISHSSQVWMIR